MRSVDVGGETSVFQHCWGNSKRKKESSSVISSGIEKRSQNYLMHSLFSGEVTMIIYQAVYVLDVDVSNANGSEAHGRGIGHGELWQTTNLDYPKTLAPTQGKTAGALASLVEK
ncbi:hypothetical protein V2G26_016858 [Clonostachys chloroleuca]